MIDDKEHRKLTWEYYKKERERIKIEIEKKNKLEVEQNNQTLIHLRNIPVEDIQKSFDDYYSDNNLDYIQLKAIVSLAYLTKADFSVLDAIDIKDIFKVNKDNALEKFLKNLKDSLSIKENSNNNIQYFNLLKSYLQSWINELEKQKIIEGQILTSIEGKKIIKSSSQRTLRYTLYEYLQSISEFQPYKDNDPSLHKLDIQFLKRNNIDKKIDYLVYEKKAVDDKLKQSELFEADIKELEITNPENYLDGISGKKTGIETGDNAKIKLTDLSFTGHTNLYNPKDKKLISSKTFIRGDLVDYTKCKYYDSSYGFLQGGKKVKTPKFETIYLANGKKLSEFERENHIIELNYGGDWLSDGVIPVILLPQGHIRIFDDEGNIQQSYYRKGNTIIPWSNDEKLKSISNLKKNYYSVILFEGYATDLYGPSSISAGEESVGIGDPEFISDEVEGGGWWGADGFFHIEKFNCVVAEFNFLDEVQNLYVLNKEDSYSVVEENYLYELPKLNEEQKIAFYKNLFSMKYDVSVKDADRLLAELHFMDYDNCLNVDKNIHGDVDRLTDVKSQGLMPIVSNEIFISGLGTFKCNNGYYEIFFRKVHNDDRYSPRGIFSINFREGEPINKQESDMLIRKAKKHFEQLSSRNN